MNLLAYDDAEHWLTYCDTLPVTRRQYVSGKYIMSLICAGTIFLLSAVAAVVRLCRSGAFNPADLTDQLAVLAAGAPYVDSAISQTVHVPAGYPLDQFEWIYFKAWSSGLKGLAKVRRLDAAKP